MNCNGRTAILAISADAADQAKDAAGARAGLPRLPVMPSSVIRRFSYDEPQRRLRVTFTSGDVYDYFDVPPEVESAFRAAFSKGRFFASDIRDRYDYRLVEKAWSRAG